MIAGKSLLVKNRNIQGLRLADFLLRLLSFLLLSSSGSSKAALVTEVVGGSGRIGSQFMRLLRETVVAIPRGASPGTLSSSDEPIYVCTPAASWKSIYEKTVANRRSDLVFVGNGLWCCCCPHEEEEITLVVPHYAVLHVGEKPTVSRETPPTYIAGKHAAITETLLQSDGIQNTEIVATECIQVKAAQKLLWASCLWLLCHSQNPAIRVSQAHRLLGNELEALVQELWPAFTRVLQQNNPTLKQLPEIQDTLQYFQAYSKSIPNAIPSLDLAVQELELRNGIFAGPDQSFHRHLVEKVAGPSALYIFERR